LSFSFVVIASFFNRTSFESNATEGHYIASGRRRQSLIHLRKVWCKIAEQQVFKLVLILFYVKRKQEKRWLLSS